MRLNNNQINKIVEYIRHHSDGMIFDVIEIEENLDDVLSYYGFCFVLEKEDREIIVRELLPLAHDFQTREVEKMVLVERW